MEENLQHLSKFYGTFGYGHEDPESGQPMRDFFVEIYAPGWMEARQVMFDNFDDKWAFVYEEKDFNPKYCPNGNFKTIKY